MKRLLLLSNSTMPGEGYFLWAKKYVKDFLGDISGNVVFIPFAGVTISWDEYFHSVEEAFESMGYPMVALHQEADKKQAVRDAQTIIVGGGNTFHLLHQLYTYDLLEVIKTKVNAGTPFVGWSAGSNICCPTIMTTNDMPVIQPASFHALGLVPFQVNPHYTEATIPHHGGESRDVRLREFIELNRDIDVIGLPEGSLLEVIGEEVKLQGSASAKLFRYGSERLEIPAGELLNSYLKKT